MNWYRQYVRIRERWIRLHTWMIARELGGFGGGGARIESPVLLTNPKNFHLGKDAVICAGSMFACVDEYAGVRYNGFIRIGDRVIVRENAQISAAAGITIGNHVGIARGVVISDHNHGFFPDAGDNYVDTPLESVREVAIEDGCFLGAYCRVAPGVRIGKRAVIGAGAVVTEDVPPYSMVVGAPGRVIKRYNFDTGKWDRI